MKMKKTLQTITIFSGFIFLMSCGNSKKVVNDSVETRTEEVESTSQTTIYKNVTAPEFKQLIESDRGVLLDVRTPEEFSQGHMDGAININYYNSNFKEEVNQIDKSQPIYVYCRSGARSSKAMLILKDLGFNEVYNLQGGYMSWPYKASGQKIKKQSITDFEKKNKVPEKPITE